LARDKGTTIIKVESRLRAIRYHLKFMVRSGAEWSADQVLVGVEGDCKSETGAVIGNEEQGSRAELCRHRRRQARRSCLCARAVVLGTSGSDSGEPERRVPGARRGAEGCVTGGERGGAQRGA